MYGAPIYISRDGKVLAIKPDDNLRLEQLPMKEIILVVEEAPKVGLIARALAASIVTQAGAIVELRTCLRGAVRCHFDKEEAPR